MNRKEADGNGADDSPGEAVPSSHAQPDPPAPSEEPLGELHQLGPEPTTRGASTGDAPSERLPFGVAQPDEQSLGALYARSLDASYTGPLPLPELLRQYEEALPGAGKLILEAFKAQTVDASRRDDRIADAELKRSSVAQGWGIVILLACVTIAAVLAFKQQVAGAWVFVAPSLLLLLAGMIQVRGNRRGSSDGRDDD